MKKIANKIWKYIKRNKYPSAFIALIAIAKAAGLEGAENATPMVAGWGIPSWAEKFVPGTQNAEAQRNYERSQQWKRDNPTKTVANWDGQGNIFYTDAPAAAAPAAGGGGGGYGGGYSNYDPYAAARAAEAARQAALAQARAEINRGYDDYDRGLLGLAPQADVLEQAETGRLTGRKDTEKTTTKSKLDRILADLLGDKAEVETGRKNTLRDVGRNYARQLVSGNLMLSNRGALDSSAAGQMALGLTSSQAGARSNVQGQANTQIADIGEQEVGANKDFEEQNRLIEDWYQTELNNIKSKTGDFKTRIDRERAGANLERHGALGNADKAGLGALGARLGNWQSNFAQISKELADALNTSKPNLNPQALTQQYDVKQLLRPNIPGLQFGEAPPQPVADSVLVPPTRKKQEVAGGILNPALAFV